jgi:hypothetical protein
LSFLLCSRHSHRSVVCVAGCEQLSKLRASVAALQTELNAAKTQSLTNTENYKTELALLKAELNKVRSEKYVCCVCVSLCVRMCV